METPTTGAKERYEILSIRRAPVLERARAFAALTIPSIMPPEGISQSQNLPETYQSFGARAVTSLSSTLMTAFYPTATKSFKLGVSGAALMAANESSVDPDTDKNLSLVEDLIQSEIDKRNWRASTFLVMQHLIVAGNALEQILPDNTIRVFRLDQFVVVREPAGKMVECLIHEELYRDSLPPELAELAPATSGPTDQVSLYTWAKYNPKTAKWDVHQELNGEVVKDSVGEYERLPYNALRWVAVVGEDYGRAKLEEHYGDLRSFEGLSESVVSGAALAARNVLLVHPNSAGGPGFSQRLSEAENGDVLSGDGEDVDMVQFENNAGMQIAVSEKDQLRQELSAAFLMNSSARRNAERVTAYELRVMIEEIEGVLGGVFTTLTNDIQDVRLRRLIVQMQTTLSIPELPEGVVDLTILTGLEALGRERDVERVTTVLERLAGIPQEEADWVDWPAILSKLFVGAGLPDAIRGKDEVQEIREQRAQMKAMERMQQQAAGSVPPAGGGPEA